MKLWRYIQGNRKGKEAHHIEIEAMKDPFLADALEGYEKTNSNHQRVVTRLQRQITNRAINKKPNHLRNWSIVASILIAVSTGTWFLLYNTPAAKDSHVVRLLKEQVPAAVPDPGTTWDSTKIMSEKTPIAQAVPADTSKAEVKVPEETAPEETMVTTEEEITPVPQDPPVIPQQDTAMRSVVAMSVNDTVSPQPVTGMQTYMDYIQRNMKLPTDEECRNIKGSVIVVFKIGQSGRPYNIRVTQGLCSSINKEVIRLIIDGPDWKKGHTCDEATITINI